ncbi:DUF4190 domain-containing protein [Streptomyces olivaceiscleroticus]|uniref:DUF4190 domain-containing protein n=1 Tax=Streptomyces olivaceiscleroticus TaxID=68245 RepID=A0ABN0ZE17_9ACTN
MTTLIHRRPDTESDETRTAADTTRTGADDTRTGATEAQAESGTGPSTESGSGAATGARRKGTQADGMAVASFILGLVGLLVMNLVLGPLSLVLGAIALHRGTTRRGRALLGMTLGAADLIVLAAIVTADGTVSWNFPA